MAELPLLLEPGQLAEQLKSANLLILDVGKPEQYARQHVPGAVHLPYARLVASEPPVMGLLPDAKDLSALFSEMGLTEDTHVVAYDDEGGGKAARLLWTLDAIGHARYSLLNGGIIAWAAEGLPTESQATEPRAREYAARLSGSAVIDREQILQHLDDPHYVFLDARSTDEFTGEIELAERGGHLPGAVNLDWLMVMDRQNNLKLKSRQELQSMLQSMGITPDKNVVTYCQTHHRSALLYFVLRYLGYREVTGYPGSWSDWGNQSDTPIATGT